MSADKVFHTNADGRGNELRNWSLEKLAVDPAGAGLYAGRFWENTSDGTIRYSPDGITVVTLATADKLEDRPRFVGGVSAATGTVPLVTPLADINAETTWDAGDFGRVTTGGTLVPAPAGGNATVQPGDILMAIVDNPTSNADFVVIESNMPQNLALTETFAVAAADFVAAGSQFEATKLFSSATEELVSFFVKNTATSEEEVFGVRGATGSITLIANVAPTASYILRVVKL